MTGEIPDLTRVGLEALQLERLQANLRSAYDHVPHYRKAFEDAGVHPDDAPPPANILSKVLTGAGPPVPVCTWVAPQRKQKPPHAEIGILHARGAKAEKRLAERELAVPDRWVVLADHSKRGLVVAVHPDAASADVLAWLLEAGAALTRIPLTGSWRVEIHRP